MADETKPDADTPKPAPAPRRPDALKVPPGIVRGATQRIYTTNLGEMFGPVLGGNIHWAHQGSFLFGRLGSTDPLEHAHNHPTLAHKSRYEWVEQGQGVSYGYLTEAARAETASPRDLAMSAGQTRFVELAKKARAGGLTEAEAGEAAGLLAADLKEPEPEGDAHASE